MGMGGNSAFVVLDTNGAAKIIKWKVKKGMLVSARQVIFIYELASSESGDNQLKFKSTQVGTVKKLLAKEGDIISPGEAVLELEECNHPTVMKDMCAECGADLRKDEKVSSNASVPMVHSIPELKVSEEQAQIIGKADENRLISDRKLVLLVDLDQTLIHTTNDNIPPNLKDVYHFRLYGHMSPWYHTRIRPRTHEFLEEISKYYELHICTFGARNYAHMIAMFLDPDGKYFSHRILSRDECFSANSKTANLKALFPCGDNMVCIIDDREDVWNFAPNLIHVKPYHFFKHTGDINAPPGLTKNENDEIDGFDFSNLDKQSGDEQQKNNEDNGSKKVSSAAPRTKVEILGESTTDKDTEDEAEKKSKNKTQSEIKAVDIEKVTGDLRLSEDDSDEAGPTFDAEKESPPEEKDGSDKKTEETKTDEVQKDNKSQEMESKPEEVEYKSEKKENKSEEKECNSEGTESKSEEKECNSEGMESKSEEKETFIEEKKSEMKLNDKVPGKSDSKVQETNTSSAKDSTPDSGSDLIEVEDPDDYLMYLEDILKNIHKSYYEEYDSMKETNKNGAILDLKEVIPKVKKRVLKDCHLVFSGLVPSHIPLHQSRAYLVAISLGATVSPDISPNCTHLVAARPGTAKVNSSRRQKGITIVTPLWLWHCAERWERLDERLYPLGRGGIANRIPPAHCGSPEHNVNSEVEQYSPALRNRTPSGRFIDTINPLLTFSSEDMKIMDQEVEDMFKEEDDDDESDSELDKKVVKTRTPSKMPASEDSSTSSSEDSLSGASHPKGWSERKSRKRKADTTTCTETEYDEEFPSVKFRRGEPLPSDLDLGDDSQDTPASDEAMDDGDWNMMGAALEREFLSGSSSTIESAPPRRRERVNGTLDFS